MTAYYNEFDPFSAQWLRELIKAGHIASGEVDERSIEDVSPNELAGFTQCHFFAGIGGWSLALRKAGWPDDKPIWTGSCPCQPFSQAGEGKGFDDERHLWPSWHWLIEQRRPSVVVGEQVASADTNPWFDLVQSDLEGVGYAFGCTAFPAASIGAPHIRDRACWVGDSGCKGLQKRVGQRGIQRETMEPFQGETIISGSYAGGMADSQGERRAEGGQGQLQAGCSKRIERDSFNRRPGPINGEWRAADWLHCRDGKWRPVEPGTFPLAHGLPGRVGRLRGYGNAIVPAQAAEFVRAARGCIQRGIND